MGTAYLELEHEIAPSVLSRWKAAIWRAARWLIPKFDYYVNGNINLQETLAMYVTWRVVGNRSMAAYVRSLQFTLHPGPKWPGFGLRFSKLPSTSLGSNGAAYLAEKGAGAPGFDPHYTILQADYAAELYALSHSPRILRLLNLLYNQLLTRINVRTLTIQTTGGSRRSAPSSSHFVSASLPVLAFATARPFMVKLALKQLGLARVDFGAYVRTGNDQDQPIGNYAAALVALDPPTPTNDGDPEGQGSYPP